MYRNDNAVLARDQFNKAFILVHNHLGPWLLHGHVENRVTKILHVRSLIDLFFELFIEFSFVCARKTNSPAGIACVQAPKWSIGRKEKFEKICLRPILTPLGSLFTG